MLKTVIGLALVAWLGMSVPIALAEQTMTVDLSKIDPDLAKKLLESKHEPTPIQNAQQWAGFGKELAIALKETAAAAGQSVNEFAKTDVGWWVIVLIVWKIVGAGIFKAVVGGLISLVLIAVWVKTFRRLFTGPDAVQFKGDGRIGAGFAMLGSAGLIILFAGLAVLG